MNIQSLLNNLHKRVESTTDSIELLMLAKAIDQLNVGAVNVVSAFSSLPSALANEGKLYFVQADKKLYWSAGLKWYYLGTDVVKGSWSWGCNSVGQLGDGTTTNRSSPVSVIGGFTDWIDVSASRGHRLGLRIGTLWSWGCNYHGQLGDGTTTYRSSPVSVVGGFTDWCQVSAGYRHNLAIRANGTAWAWGNNTGGVLGDNTQNNKSSPVPVVGGFTDWCQVSAGYRHNLAIRANGTAWAWGQNSSGQLGDGTITNRSSPVSVVGGFTDWCQVSAGGSFSLGLRQNGTVWAWGSNSSGKLGSNNTTGRSSPASVVGGFTDWCQVSAGANHSLGLRQNGTLWAWGSGYCGKLGDGTFTGKSSPVSVVGGFTDWCQVSAGDDHSLGLRQNGTLWSWGCNSNGALGDGTAGNKSSPVSVVGGFTDWSKIAEMSTSAGSLAIRITQL